MGYADQTTDRLRELARSRGVAWRDDDGKALRKAPLIKALEQADAVAEQWEADAEAEAYAEAERAEAEAAHDAAEAPQAPVAPVPPESPQEAAAPETDESPTEAAPAPEASQSAEAAPETATSLQHYRVVEDSKWAKGGILYKLAAGTVVSKRTHDLAQLRAQRVHLEPCGALARPTDSYGRPLGRAWGPPVPSTRRQVSADELLHPQMYGGERAEPVQMRADGTREVLPVVTPRIVRTPDGRNVVADEAGMVRTPDGRLVPRR